MTKDHVATLGSSFSWHFVRSIFRLQFHVALLIASELLPDGRRISLIRCAGNNQQRGPGPGPGPNDKILVGWGNPVRPGADFFFLSGRAFLFYQVAVLSQDVARVASWLPCSSDDDGAWPRRGRAPWRVRPSRASSSCWGCSTWWPRLHWQPRAMHASPRASSSCRPYLAR